MIAKDFARFWSQVGVTRNPAECWPWLGDTPRNRGGYGRFSIGNGSRRAHTVAYEMAHGPIPVGHVVRHQCDNPPCCNPAHLLDGTHADNTRDMFERGRNPNRQGENHPLAHVGIEEVRKIRRLAAMGETHKALAGAFGVSRQQIGKIVRRENWKHV